MSSQSPLIIGGIKLPLDLSPVQRATLKAISYAVMIAVFNVVLTLIAILDQGKAVSWNTVLISLVAQAGLAIMSTLKKFYSAQGDIPTSTLIQLAQNEVLAHAPSVPALSTNQLALQQTVGQIFDPSKIVQAPPQVAINQPPVQNSASPAQVSFQVSQPKPVVQPVQRPSVDNIPLTNTIPNLTAVSGS